MRTQQPNIPIQHYNIATYKVSMHVKELGYSDKQAYQIANILLEMMQND